MKILVLNGSPKDKSDTMRLTSSFLKGMKKRKDLEIEIIHLIKKNIKPCVGCFRCWKNNEGQCFQDDDQKEIMDKYEKADVIIWSFPLYSYAMPSHVKAVVDRLIPFNKMTMKEVNGHVVHAPRVDLSSKKLLFIAGCGFPNFDDNFEGLKIMIENKFGPKAETIFVSETPMLNEKEAEPLTTPLLNKFVEAGKYYSLNLSLSEKIKKELETPMLPKETYIKIVNSL
ncbi:MAG: flavodoxin family protein [Bacilli bacterium]|nr:flavodoxin family protein [Bacilli bacterium]